MEVQPHSFFCDWRFLGRSDLTVSIFSIRNLSWAHFIAHIQVMQVGSDRFMISLCRFMALIMSISRSVEPDYVFRGARY